MPTINDIIEMETEFLKAHGRKPVKLNLTYLDEIDLITSVCVHLTLKTVNEVTNAGRLKGLLPKLHGMDVVYESDKTYLE